MEIEEGGLIFSFPNPCEATKYDDWEFYRKQFQSVAGGAKAVDILCVAQDVAWLIEIKDYRQHPRSKSSDVGDEVVSKVRDTLAGLAAANANATSKSEQAFAERALAKQRWRVALHLEQQSVVTSPLRPLAINPANVLKKLRMNLKAIDAQPVVVSLRRPGRGTPWTVQ
jgi:hypothetical protein